MKTTKIYSALSFVLIFAAVSSAFGSAIGKITGEGFVNTSIHYVVNVNLTVEKPLCNTYLIEIRDGQGKLVAPVQRFVPGVSKYDFYERGPASGVRIAGLVRSNYGDHFICAYEIFTTPAVVNGPFKNGVTYRFDLFPSLQPIKD